ncbi:DUF2513 domain-containing protein [Paenibacillus humicus]|uniref:DUF2513 domain-containing protein n=1 Tax=Paenibacillus humicus TaxID=412861 RepID=UPI003D2E6791
MKLDRDCVRDLLLFVESLDHGQIVQSDDLSNIPALASHSSEAINYTVEKLDEAGYLNVQFMRVLGGEDPFFIKSITWDGHQFLDNIRDDGIWKETKKVTSKVASVSVGILTDVAASVMKKTLGLE